MTFTEVFNSKLRFSHRDYNKPVTSWFIYKDDYHIKLVGDNLAILGTHDRIYDIDDFLAEDKLLLKVDPNSYYIHPDDLFNKKLKEIVSD